MKLWRIVFIQVVFASFVASTTWASTCEIFLEVSHPTVPTFSTSLPSSFQDLIKSHPIYKLKTILNKGKDYSFFVQHYAANGLMNKESQIFLGETNQADFTVKVLKTVFPEGDFVDQKTEAIHFSDGFQSQLERALNSKSEVHFLIYDSYHEDMDINEIHLNMPLIKAANPLVPEGFDHKLRKMLGFSMNEKIVSVYGSLDYTTDNPIHGGEVAKDIFRAHPDVEAIVLSRQSGHPPIDTKIYNKKSRL